MYKLIKIKKIENGFNILLKNKEYKKKFWLTAMFKDDDIMFDWKDKNCILSTTDGILRSLIQSSQDEFTDACASALCYLEKKKYITITDDFKIMKAVS